jgi:hypothetical protein
MLRKLFLTVIGCCMLTSLSGQVTNHNFNEDEDRKDWSFSFTPYALLASQSTNVGGESIRQSFGDLSSMTNAGFQFIAAVRYKRFGFSLDGTLANLVKEEPLGPLQIKLNLDQQILDFKGSYVLFETFQMEDNRVIDGWSLEALAGAKYWQNEVKVDYALFFDDVLLDEDRIVDQKQDWWDLMLGVRTTISLSPRVLLSSWINFGGFGIGSSSKLTYDFTYLNAFRVSRLITINAGFRNFRYRRVDGEGDSELETRVNVLGPFLGVSFIFN